jgi:type IV secretion system protein VirD4
LFATIFVGALTRHGRRPQPVVPSRDRKDDATVRHRPPQHDAPRARQQRADIVGTPTGAARDVARADTRDGPVRRLAQAVRDASVRAGSGIYLGRTTDAWYAAPPEHAVLVLGPPRSGKTSGFVVPNLLAASGPVVSTSTKPDVMAATGAVRRDVGRCLLFDPSGTVACPSSVSPVRWSPVQAACTWDGALGAARVLVLAAGGGAGGQRVEQSHWTERAQALLAPLLYAAAIDGASMRTVLTWVDRHQSLPAQTVLAAARGPGSGVAADLLAGVAETDARELSGIWSTASGALAGLRSEAALAATDEPDFDPARFVESADTLYVVAPADRQMLVAPLVAGLVDAVRAATYERAAGPAGATHAPVLLALDEVANIAPLPALPAMVSEGGGQGLLTLACLQDLSQARHRWGGQADGFASLFGTTVVLPGIGDVTTLEALSVLAGEVEVPMRTLSHGRGPTGRSILDLVAGGRAHTGASVTTQWRRRLPPDVVASGAPGCALAFDERNRAHWVPLAPAHRCEPWRSLVAHARALDAEASLAPHPPGLEPPDRHRSARPGWPGGLAR